MATFLPLPLPLIPLTADDPFKILYAGDAYGIVEGAVQVNLPLPAITFGGCRQATVRCGSSSAIVNVCMP